MTELLSKEHSILEKGFMEYRPFGVTPSGERIRDTTGVKIRAYVDYLEESMSRARGPEAGERAVKELCRQLNERIRDPAYHVTPKFLKNVWNSYSYEFVCFLAELCEVISGDSLFSAHVGEEKFLSAIIQTLGRPFSVQQIYQRFPHFGEKFSSLILAAEQVTDRSAVLSMRYPPEVSRQFGPYRQACADLICQSARAALAAVPEKIHHQKRAIIKDLSCVANGDDCCTWELHWEPQQRKPAAEVGAGVLGGCLAFASVLLLLPDAPILLPIVFAVPAAAAAWLGYRLRILRRYVKAREELIQEQLQFVEARHEELRAVYLEQEQTAVTLREKVNQLTALHNAGLIFSSTLDRDTIIEAALQTLVKNLKYDRAMLCFYDPDRRVSHDFKIHGATPEVAAFVSSLEIPALTLDGPEAMVLMKGMPLLVGDIQEVWSVLHPLNQRLATLTQVKSFISVPLKVKDRILGALTVDRTHEGMLTVDDLNLMVTFANQVAISLTNIDAYRQIEELYVGLEEKVRERTFELERADRHRSMFLSHVSHELRTPLTSIKGFIENLLGGIAGPLPDKHQTYLTRIGVNADRLIRMIANLLDQTRIDQGKIELSPSEIDLRKSAADVMEQLRASAAGKKQRLEAFLPESPVTVWADADCLVQIFTNLLHNAIKFTSDGGQITVLIRTDGQQASVTVTDTGRGIPDDVLPTIFNPFSRIGQEQGFGEKGLGLGLSIVKTLVELHGGGITVASQVGKGSSFQFTVPLSPAARGSEERGRGGGKRILVVDDDPDILQLLLDRLNTYGYQVETAVAGGTALEAIRANTFDGMILDIGMPDIDGLEVLRRIRERDSSIPIIMVTASGSKERAVQAVNMGAQAYLLKPFEAVQLKDTVERWFGPAIIERR